MACIFDMWIVLRSSVRTPTMGVNSKYMACIFDMWIVLRSSVRTPTMGVMLGCLHLNKPVDCPEIVGGITTMEKCLSKWCQCRCPHRHSPVRQPTKKAAL